MTRIIRWAYNILGGIDSYYWNIAFALFVLVSIVCLFRYDIKSSVIWGIFISYIFIVFTITLLSRSYSEETYNFIPFWSYYEFIFGKRKYVIYQVALNIVLMIPFGVLFPLVYNVWSRNQLKANGKTALKVTLFFGGALSIVIEVLQLLSHKGLCETDDLLHNVLGVYIGYCILDNSKKYSVDTKE